MSLHKKHRPTELDEMMGNKQLRKLLQKKIEEGTIPQSILLTGPSGCGKTTIARILAKELHIKDLDFQELDTANFRGIDTAREIRSNINLRPIASEKRMWLLDECHKLTKDAQNALLKPLEEPPGHVYFVLATTNPDELLLTVRNRCAQFEVKPLQEMTMYRLLRRVAKKEGARLSPTALKSIASSCSGSPRVGLVLLEKVLHMKTKEEVEGVVKREVLWQSTVTEFCRALFYRKKWKEVTTIVRGLSEEDPERLRRAVRSYFYSVLLSKEDPNAYLILKSFEDPIYNNDWSSFLTACYEVVGNMKGDKDTPY